MYKSFKNMYTNEIISFFLALLWIKHLNDVLWMETEEMCVCVC